MDSLDLQNNGCYGLDFNATELPIEKIPAWLDAHARHGGGQMLATIITASLPEMQQRIRHVLAAREAHPQFAKCILGFHLEGPFISPVPGYVGAHPPADVVPACLDTMKRLTEACDGLLRLVTLAPEHDAQARVTAWLAGQGIRIAAGHTDASLDDLGRGIDAGLSLFTHLGNGCPTTLPRHDNIIQRALSLADKLHYGLIPDGAHIPFFALKNYLRSLPLERVFMVTDAMTAAGMPPGDYTLGKATITVGEDLVARAPGGPHLAGSTLTMARLRQNLATELHMTPQQIDWLTNEGPQHCLAYL